MRMRPDPFAWLLLAYVAFFLSLMLAFALTGGPV